MTPPEMCPVGIFTAGIATGGMVTEGMFTGGMFTASAGMLALSSPMNLPIKAKTFSISSMLGLFSVTATGSLSV